MPQWFELLWLFSRLCQPTTFWLIVVKPKLALFELHDFVDSFMATEWLIFVKPNTKCLIFDSSSKSLVLLFLLEINLMTTCWRSTPVSVNAEVPRKLQDLSSTREVKSCNNMMRSVWNLDIEFNQIQKLSPLSCPVHKAVVKGINPLLRLLLGT